MEPLRDKYVNPFTDFGFKRLFGSESYKELLIDFLNTMLPERHKIKNLTYRQNERLGRSEVDRKAIFDLYCESNSGEYFIVEIQKAKQKYFKDRSIFYASFPIQEQALTGEWNFKLSAVYMVGILDFVFDDEEDVPDKYFHQVKLKEVSTNKIFYDKLTFLYLELPKFTKSEAELESHFDKWLYAFKHLSSLHDRPLKLQERIFTRLFEAAAIVRFTPTERQEYEDSLKVYRDLKNSIDTAVEEGWIQGHAKGVAEGRAEGRVEGHAKGRAEGLEEGQMKMAKQVAQKLLATGMNISSVADIMNLSIKEIESLMTKEE
jgi:predicted transposase/invertase (TIGR01784 family)